MLLERNLVLTARHCVAFTTGSSVVCGSSPFGDTVVGPNIVSTTELVMPTDSPDTYVAAARGLVPPDGNDECGFDVAAVIAGNTGSWSALGIPMSSASVMGAVIPSGAYFFVLADQPVAGTVPGLRNPGRNLRQPSISMPFAMRT